MKKMFTSLEPGDKIYGAYHDEAVYRFNTKELKESARFGYMFKKALGTCYYKDVKMVA